MDIALYGDPQSPIEKLLLDRLPEDILPDSAVVEGREFRRLLYVACQFNVVHRKYRTDFMLWEVLPDGHFTAGVVVECDGHEFHEKTKAQAQNDKLRDRVLQSCGHRVLHFTGSEIYRDPSACWSEVAEHLERQWRDATGVEAE